LQTALKLGMKAFDTAPWYGAGFSEDYFGEVLGDHPEVEISTKAGRVIKRKEVCDVNDDNVAFNIEDFFKLDGTSRGRVPVHDYSAAGIRRSSEDSVMRLKGHRIKCLRLHDAESPEYYYTATQKGAAVDELVKIKQDGLVDEISLGMNDASYILKFIRKYPVGTFDNIMLAGCWNLVDQSGYEVLQECQKRNIKVVQAGVFGSGLLWGSTHLRYDKAPKEAIDKVRRWEKLCKKHNVSLPAVAINFTYLPEIVEYVCVGCKKPRYVETNVALLKETIPVQLWTDAKKEGLLADWIPVPKVSSL